MEFFFFFYKKAGEETAREIVSLLKHEFSEINITEELRNDIYSAKINNINGYDVEVSEFRLMVKFPPK